MRILDIFETTAPKTFVWRKRQDGLTRHVEKKSQPKIAQRQTIVTKDRQ